MFRREWVKLITMIRKAIEMKSKLLPNKEKKKQKTGKNNSLKHQLKGNTTNTMKH